MLPFRRMIHYGLAAVMMAHVLYPQADSEPAGFSRYWIDEILRKRLDFQGLVFSDDLSMQGASCAGDHVARARASLEAGCDMVLVCNERAQAIRVAEALADYANPIAHSRMVRMHGRHAMSLEELHATGRWEQAVAAVTGYEENPELDLEP
jgi:beta-N-acetylhexosaminidase